MIDACCSNAEIRLDFAFLFKFSSLSIEEKLHTYAGLERIEFDVVNRSWGLFLADGICKMPVAFQGSRVVPDIQVESKVSKEEIV